jgi:hypothetical protein
VECLSICGCTGNSNFAALPVRPIIRRFVDQHVAEVAQRDGLGIPIGAVRQLIVRGRNPFEAAEALLREARR